MTCSSLDLCLSSLDREERKFRAKLVHNRGLCILKWPVSRSYVETLTRVELEPTLLGLADDLTTGPSLSCSVVYSYYLILVTF